ncbi:MAG: tetratricopeptide repeat protein [Planctomycetaceae bacterium]
MIRPRRLPIVLWSVLVLGVVLVGVWVCGPSDKRWHQEFEQGWTALKQGDWPQVSRHIHRLKQNPAYAEHARVLLAGWLIRTGDPRGGLEVLSKGTSRDDLRERAMLLTCEALYQLKRWLEAAAVARDILGLPQHGSEVHRWLGAIYYDLGAMSQAEEHLKTLATLEPNDSSAFRMLGMIHSDFERYREAIDDYRQAMKRNPPVAAIPELRLGLAKALAKNNDFDAALKTLESAVTEDAVEAQAFLAECLWSVGRKDEARATLARIQSRAPNDPQVLWRVARFAMDEGQNGEAILPLTKMIEADPFHHQALMELASAHRRLGNLSQADEFLSRRNAAHALLEKMVALNKRAIQEPANADVREELGDVCDQLGKAELATAWRDAARALRSLAPPTK